ncbi:DUF6638 family protein [Histidinibacterium aquaticum]|uniref:Uncharacterized protein n=1 Tax=Histidinibacterium aquaticum TaxID=2613962 RepID=A0A5J5GSG0_9RHOB|nr:DUF6638 family protein [Histidinibacterium aquaticum]KAA9010484.1 hypothetical protein F3S47_04365 [Histidinibacterium aquaticum]
MKRLIERGLMFGNLVHVASPVLVERYNRALEHLTGRTTALTDFHIDISGYSPEVGQELGDPLYLNPKGVNRQFILLTTAQKTAPLLDATFSTSRGILRQFIETNEAQLFALTAKDAVAGELVNSVFVAETPADLFTIRKITVEADTTEGTVRTAERLGTLIDRFRTEEDAWYDDVLIAEMIGLARETGDVVRNPVRLERMTFDQQNSWTALFGGLYLFRGVPEPGVIAAGDKAALGPMPVDTVLDLSDRNAIAGFLERNGLVEPIVRARGIDGAAILHQKMEFITAATAAGQGETLTGATRRDLRRIARRHADLLPPEYHHLAALARWAEDAGPWPRITADDAAYFYTLRAAAGPDADLVNQLLAELSPLDVRQLFICHKPAFYAAYATWPEEKRAYVAELLATEYAVDKAGTREALFGHEAPMDDPAPAADPELLDRVGPWGAVRRR